MAPPPVQTRPTEVASTHVAEVWFGDTPVCRYRGDINRAKAYADAMARRYTGLRVTLDGHPHQPGPHS